MVGGIGGLVRSDVSAAGRELQGRHAVLEQARTVVPPALELERVATAAQ